MAGLLEFLLLTIIWTPVLVLLHELGHAAAAVLLTRPARPPRSRPHHAHG